MTGLTAPDPQRAPAEPAFATPWQARAAALLDALRERGLVGAHEWSSALGAAKAAGADEEAELAALETLLAGRGLASAVLIRAVEGRQAPDHPSPANEGRPRAAPIAEFGPGEGDARPA